MNRHIEIKGGAGEIDAAVIAVVIDRINREEASARQSRGDGGPGLPAWIRAIKPESSRLPWESVNPD